MTNEELVLAIQQGKQDAIEELWLQVEEFIRNKADDYLKNCPEECRSLEEDMIQQAYFELFNAVNRFDATRGYKFTTYLDKCLQSPFREVLFSGRGSRLENDPLNNCDSLDRRLFENSDGTMVTVADTIADKLPGEQTEYVTDKGQAEIEDDDYWRSVNEYIKRLVDESGSEVGAALYRYMLDHDCTFRDAVLVLYNEDIQDRKIRGKYEYHKKQTERNIRKKWNTPSAKEERRKIALDFISLGRYGLRDTGLNFFREKGMSSVEAAVILRNKQ